MPPAGSVVQIRPGHSVLYDHQTQHPLRMVHVAGELTFSRDVDTRLDVGLLKIGGDLSEDGFNAPGHVEGPRAVLEIGTPDDPMPAERTARIRLAPVDGQDPESCPALLCCGGRMDLHGAPLSRTWVKLGSRALAGETVITLTEPVVGWRRGDRVILTATTRQNKRAGTFRTSTRDNTQTEERIIQSIQGAQLTLDQPLAHDHICFGPYRGEVANLSRNVIVESSQPDAARGHTMYHHGSRGSIGYAEFRQLGKRGVLARYSVHFHLARDSMRGSSVVGASIWGSQNRWLTVHGTDYLVVRDCVGYDSLGHGFFLEDGSEVFNIFDSNLAVQARTAQPLPKQAIPFDHNDGAGFWWANSLNSFTRNVACECDEYGFRLDAQMTPEFTPLRGVLDASGQRRLVDIRTLPFVRFEDNESHCQRRHAFNLGGFVGASSGGCGRVGPDEKHPFIIRNMRVWNSHWSFHSLAPCVMLDGFDVHDVEYGLWRMNFDRHAYRGLRMTAVEIDDYPAPRIGDPPKEADFPGPLRPLDDRPPVVVVTYAGPLSGGHRIVLGVASDDGQIKAVHVNGSPARALRPNFAEWEAQVAADSGPIVARATDGEGHTGEHRAAIG